MSLPGCKVRSLSLTLASILTGYEGVSYDRRMLAIPWRLVPEDDALDTGNLLVDAAIDGRSCSLVLDSAAPRTEFIADDYFATLPTSAQHSSGGVSGQRRYGDVVTITGLTAGDLTTGPVPVVRAEPLPGCQHLLGLDLLGQYCCEFRFTSAELRLSDSPDGRGDLDLQRGGSGHIYLDLVWGGASATTVWDCGASITAVDAAFAAAHPALFKPAGETTGTDHNGATISTPLVTMAGPVIAGVEFAPSTAAIVDLSTMNQGVDLPMSVIAGVPLLRQADWLFDLPAGRYAAPRRAV
jgi:hypothetical protein